MIDNKKVLINKDSIKLFHNSILAYKMKKYILYDNSKCPISPFTGYRCTNSLSMHATDFEMAYNALKKYKNAVGIGIVLGASPLGNISCIDIDQCIQKCTINTQTQEIIKRFQTYAETSQSGKGVHILFIANKNGNRCKNNDLTWCKALELYSKSDRYIALTFNKIGNDMLENRQSECNSLYDKYLAPLESKKDFENGGFNLSSNLEKGLKVDKKLIEYWNGNIQTSDESRKDMGFMAKLIFWCGYDIDYAIKAFKSSPYAAQKDQLHYKKMLRSDYLLRTAQKCLKEVI